MNLVRVGHAAASAILMVASCWPRPDAGLVVRLVAATPHKLKAAQLKLVSFVPGQYTANEAVAPVSVARYDLPANRLIFTQKNARVVVVTGVEPANTSGFEINGLVDPDIQIVRGARITFDVINLKISGKEYFWVQEQPPPYEPPAQDPWPWSRHRPIGVGRRILPALPGREFLHAIADVVVTYEATSAGTAYYVGPGYAGRDGLYGRIIVVP